MSFEHELLPTAKDNGCSKYAGLRYYTPRVYVKRVYPWLNDVTPGMLSNKKQAVEAAISRPDFMHRTVYPLDKASIYPLIPSQARGELISRPSQFLYMADSSSGANGMNAGRKDFKNTCQGDASAHSHHLCEIVKTKVNHIHGSEHVMSTPTNSFLRKADDGRLLRTAICNKCYGTFLSLGRPPQIKDGSNTPVDVIQNEELDLRLTLGRNSEENIVSGTTDEEPKHASSTAITYNRTIGDYPKYAHLLGATSQTNIIESNAHWNNIPVYVIHNGGGHAYRTLGCNYKQRGNVIVFGGVKVTANDEAMVDNQNSAQSSTATSRVSVVEPNAHFYLDRNLNWASNAKKHNAFEREKPRMIGAPHPNAYLSSIPSLLSTGIFDGAPVKYILKRRKITLCGVIKGQKILCSCNKCNNSEYIGPYKFELHAGGRTRHPNACIYLENGKTIYEVFQVLRDTPEDMLFHVIPIVAGSAVSRLHFHLWKAAAQALHQNNAEDLVPSAWGH